MFYYLLYNSSFSFIIENRLFTTILYGSILYIITHAIINNCNIELLAIINNYFWYIFILDMISLLFAIYHIYTNLDNHDNMNVSFNHLKNKINTLINNKQNENITITTQQPISSSSKSTPLHLIKTRMATDIPELVINEEQPPLDDVSDLDSNMDLNDFEKSL